MPPNSVPTARLDRLLSLYVFGPLASCLRRPDEVRIPILMYHSIADDTDAQRHPYFRTVTTPAAFERQMRYLWRAGYEVLTLSQATALLKPAAVQPLIPNMTSKSHGTPRRLVVLTFDDGFRDFYTNAFPILDSFGFKATVFVSTGCIDRNFVTGRACLRTQEIIELARNGIEFGSHTVNHVQLKQLTTRAIVHELAASKQAVEDIVGSEAPIFAYPYRFPEEDVAFVRKLAALLKEQGYSAGVTTAIGRTRPVDDSLFQRRLPVNDCDDTRLLRAKLEGAYDWLHAGQLMRKKLRAGQQQWKTCIETVQRWKQ